MRKNVKFPNSILELLQASKILGVRAGSEHRYTGVWSVIIEGRLFVRSWNDKPTGWYQAFRREPDGSIQVAKLEVPVRAKPVRSERIRTAVTEAFAQKYNTKGSRKWVEGFAESERELTTLEVVPR